MELDLKASVFPLSVVKLNSLDYPQLARILEQKRAMAPGFFNYTPAVLDLQSIDEAPDFNKLKQLLTESGMVPVAIHNASEQQKADASQCGLAILTASQSTNQKQSQPSVKYIEQPVRSGQQIYFPGDLIICAPVGAGAEVIADGNIHIYGALRGRALAGAKGNRSARIYCQQLKAELVSIAGCFQVSEDFPETENKTVEIRLAEDRLQMRTL
ncbi:septum site-determining protein MinC [Pelagibaculum spongiae]|uniref:Probable septum site-determining protein MinC n=1 Tax=Pelagibaculum spongiae TaxID=2080658 RepID=A0A2V1GPL6_9GAMM|nr:septum site-determining protein MinC [Pelagibaculum spongiae]PVZ64966.1 septum site-determining protein MinC [Pelagibaculum spongiae]